MERVIARRFQVSWVMKSTGALLLVVFLALVINQQRASAVANENTANIPQYVIDYLRTCDTSTNHVAQASWLSVAGQPLVQETTVGYGSTSVDLQINVIVYVCRYGLYPWTGDVAASRIGTNFGIVDSTPLGIGLVGKTALVTYDNPPNNRFNVSTIPFTYTFPPATTSRYHTISYGNKAINLKRAGGYECVTNPGTPNNYVPGHYNDFAACNSIGGADFSMYINVGPQGSINYAETSCTAISGLAEDGDSPNTAIEIHIYRDYPPGVAPPAGQPGAGNIFGGQIATVWADAGTNRYSYALVPPDSNNHTYYVFMLGVNGAGQKDGNNPQASGSPVTIGPCPPSCGNLTLSQNPVERGVPFNVTASFNASVNPASPPVPYSITLSMSGPGIVTIPPPATKGPFSLAPGSTGGGSATWNGVVLSAVGSYSGTYIVSGGINLTCPFGTGAPGVPPPPVAVAKPYFSLINGDIATGMGTCPGWGVGTGGTLTSWNNGVIGAGNRGSGTNLAAFASGNIVEFASAQQVSGSTAPKNLSFANTSGTFGGGFGNAIPCPTDYVDIYEKLRLSGSTTPITSNNNVPNTNNVYHATGNFKLNGGTITGGNRPVIYVNGDVSIDGDVIASSGVTIGTLSNFYLIVRGDIYIGPDVNRLDGVYVAQPNGVSKGRIYTCSRNGAYQPPLSPQLNGISGGGLSSCIRQLTVNGAFIAKELKLYRSIGSMSTGTPAEVFNYTPATWLAVPSSIHNRTAGSGYNSITSLPPIL